MTEPQHVCSNPCPECEQHYSDVNFYAGVTVDSYKTKPIDYIDPAPKPFIVQIPLVEYFERVKRLKADRWQKHFCNYLQTAVTNRHIKGTFAEFHAQAQLGKTVILSQVFKAWCFGHDPLWRAILAMYNVSRSETHSEVIISIMRSQMHLDIFHNKDGHLPVSVSKAGWSTNARMDVESGRIDGQKSFSPVGLQSGITGSSADWYTIDDPYKEPAEAFSEAVRTALTRFWEYGIQPRSNIYTCIAAMFHRYAIDDFGGYLLDTGKFDYVRYAAVADGPYIHEETGQRFNDPLGREVGEYISERFPPSYYDDKRTSNRVFLSMFQGRPTSEEGDFFNVGRIQIIEDPVQAELEWSQCTVKGRGWDIAITQGGGDFSAGGLMGIQANGDVVVADMILEQLDSETRIALQRSTAEKDGRDVTVVIPEEIGPAAKDAVFLMEQRLQGFNVIARKVTNANPGSTPKARRAHNLGVAVNAGRVKFLSGEWNKPVLRSMRNFLYSTFDDPIDALSDVYNYLYESFHKGLVIKGFSATRHLVGWKGFRKRFGQTVPLDWTVYIGVTITPDASMPNSAVIVARPPESARLPDTLFVVAEYKEYTANYMALFDWISETVAATCEGKAAIIWLDKESEAYKPTIQQKLKFAVRIFDEDALSGITELNWYLQSLDTVHPFTVNEKASRLYGLIDEDQWMVAADSFGLINLRQEAATWAFDKNGEPNKVGSVMNCLKMAAFRFRSMSKPLTIAQKVNLLIPEEVKKAMVMASTGEEKLVAVLDYEFQKEIAMDTIDPERVDLWEDWS